MNISRSLKLLLRNPNLAMARKKQSKYDPLYLKVKLDEKGRFQFYMVSNYFGKFTPIQTPVILSVNEIIASNWTVVDLDKINMEPTQSTKCSECHAYCELNNHEGFCSLHNFIMKETNHEDNRCYKMTHVIPNKFWQED